MTPDPWQALLAGHHADPFGLLGPHKNAQGKWEVRVFQPQVKDTWLLAGGDEIPMHREHPYGLFAATVDSDPGPYTLRFHWWHGDTTIAEDPYRFPPVLTPFEIHLHAEGTNYESYRTLGAHLVEFQGFHGVRFAVWAPNASTVSVVGDFNGWDTRVNPMRRRDGGIWEIFVPNLRPGVNYKYCVRGPGHHHQQLKADPYGFYAEIPPQTASVVYGIEGYEWGDTEWMNRRASVNVLKHPFSVYEVHLGSWLHGDGGRFLTYRELADTLVPYAKNMGFTHLELMPPMEHPFSGSWGYQVVGYYAPTSRYGTPHDFMHFVDRCHQAGIGVIIDWVPAHFPRDAHGLARFDGTALYEHEDPRLGAHPDWGTLIFNFGRNEVKTFLLSNALFWLKQYHIDGLRVDAVASMLYLDYSRNHGEWIPNRYGGRENLEALDFLRSMNELVHAAGGITIAEESTSWPGVSRPVYLNGLGFTMKWNMGWMHDMFHYFKLDPIYRKFNQTDITFSLLYAFTENFVLPISHDEVVHLKGSLIGKMPGDEWRKFANVRAFLAYMYGHPGKKLLFMGQEIGQYEEWNENVDVRWELLEYDYHRKLQSLVRNLNSLYQSERAMHQVDFNPQGFEWIDLHDVDSSVISFVRRADDPADFLVFVCNFTPLPRYLYRIGVPQGGAYRELLNSDDHAYGGSGVSNGGVIVAEPVRIHERPFSLSLTLPPLAVLILKPVSI